VLASSVIVSHSFALSGRLDQEWVLRFSGGQESLGGLAVAGFFVVSGFLVTASALKASPTRYAWRRFIRIFPGFWVCLLVTAFVFAPLMWLCERGFTGGFLQAPQGPGDYVRANALIGMKQDGISGLLMNTPYGVESGTSMFNGSLWTLVYEVACYVALGILAVTVLKRTPRLAVVSIVATLYLGVVWVSQHGWFRAVGVPLVGTVDLHWLIFFGFCFALGALFEVFKSSIPIHDAAGMTAAATLVASLYFGGYLLIGPVALAYVIIWLAIRLPHATRRIGRENDYSYGIYIYAFPVQQMLAEIGIARLWLPLYVVAAFLLTVPLAMLSWHLVESRAMKLRHLQLPQVSGEGIVTVLVHLREQTMRLLTGPPATAGARRARERHWSVGR
jgi:peptidoglycan/LPS O-acetylase OafA/YrhL